MDPEAPPAADSARFRVEPGERVALAELDPADTGGVAGEEATGREYDTLSERLSGLQERLQGEDLVHSRLRGERLVDTGLLTLLLAAV